MTYELTEQAVRDYLALIESVKDDDEEAHGHQEDLLFHFIENIAKRDDRDGELARLVLTVRDIEFSRWYA